MSGGDGDTERQWLIGPQRLGDTTGALLRRRRETLGVVALAGSLLGPCALQVASGAIPAVLSAPPAAQDVHLAGAAAIWVCVVALVAALS